MHNVMIQPGGGLCDECERLCHAEPPVEGLATLQAVWADHRAAQDAAIARAGREAAGDENPVAWLLGQTDFANWDRAPRMISALRRIVAAARTGPDVTVGGVPVPSPRPAPRRPLRFSLSPAEEDARRSAAIRAHDCTRSGCGPVCTFGDW